MSNHLWSNGSIFMPENRKLREQKQKPYIKPQTYEKWKKRSFKKDISKRENMGYDERTDTYTCYAGKKLQPIFLKKQTSKSGYESKVIFPLD